MDDEKKDLLKIKLKKDKFTNEEITAIAGKLKQGLKNKYGDGQVKETISSEEGKIKFKHKIQGENSPLEASTWFS